MSTEKRSGMNNEDRSNSSSKQAGQHNQSSNKNQYDSEAPKGPRIDPPKHSQQDQRNSDHKQDQRGNEQGSKAKDQ